ncbi:MAG: YciI family protein [Pseudomonadota bacterium]
MHFIIHALDKTGALPARQKNIAKHRAYITDAPAKHGIRTLMSGPLTEDDGTTMKGSFFLLDAPDRGAVEALLADDPLAKAEVWGSLTITNVSIRTNIIGSLEEAH